MDDFTMRGFDFSSLSFQDKREQENVEVPKLNHLPVMFENAQEAALKIEQGKDYFCIVSGSFVFGDFIEALCLERDIEPDAIWLTTLGMNDNNIDSIVNLVEDYHAKQVNLIVSHYWAGVERHNLVPYMQNEFSGRPVNVAVLQSHMKLAVIQSPTWNVLIAGSANLSSSNNVEQFVIMNSKSAIEFATSKMKMVMDKFRVIDNGGPWLWSKNMGNTGRKAFDVLKGE